MTKLLERALAELAKLPEQDQDAIAALILEEIEGGRRWDESSPGRPMCWNGSLTRRGSSAERERRRCSTPTTYDRSHVGSLHAQFRALHVGV
jgi:hypothetical protein